MPQPRECEPSICDHLCVMLDSPPSHCLRTKISATTRDVEGFMGWPQPFLSLRMCQKIAASKRLRYTFQELATSEVYVYWFLVASHGPFLVGTNKFGHFYTAANPDIPAFDWHPKWSSFFSYTILTDSIIRSHQNPCFSPKQLLSGLWIVSEAITWLSWLWLPWSVLINQRQQAFGCHLISSLHIAFSTNSSALDTKLLPI